MSIKLTEKSGKRKAEKRKQAAICLIGALALGSGARAAAPDAAGGPYHGIVERNVFDIRPPAPPPPPDPNANKPPPPNIKLQGITDILKKKQVLFKVQLPAKPPAPAKEESYILTEGERVGEITVLEIDVKGGTVKMDNYGIITNLSLDLNSDKLVTTAPPTMPTPTAPGMQPSGIPSPQLPTLPTGRIPPRTLRLPGSANTQPNPGLPSAPGYGGGTVSPQRANQFSTEEQAIIMEAQRMKYQQEGNPIHTIFPPTPLNPTANMSPPPLPPGNPASQ